MIFSWVRKVEYPGYLDISFRISSQFIKSKLWSSSFALLLGFCNDSMDDLDMSLDLADTSLSVDKLSLLRGLKLSWISKLEKHAEIINIIRCKTKVVQFVRGFQS
jgi:hypothetical protein